MSWYTKSFNDAIRAFDSDLGYGLTVSQSAQYLTNYGPNKLAESKKVSIIIKFFLQFNDFMIVLLLIAAGISAGVTLIQGESDFLDPIIIVGIVTLNAILGVVQESKAEKAIEALKKMSAPKSRVLRNGRIHAIDTAELVPGDIIMLKSGDMVGADARLIESVNLSAEESALTGESMPAEKNADGTPQKDCPIGDRHTMVFAGTTITTGRAKAIVIATGMHTEMGRIADSLLENGGLETPLQKKLAKTGKTLGLAAIIICTIIFLIGILQRFSPMFMFMTSVSLAVAAIPEGLPAVVTIVLAIGVQRMVKRKAVIRRLPAVETLGSATVICSDKTGTLTQNKMSVVEIDGNNKELMLKYACLCNDTIVDIKGSGPEFMGDPTESALVSAAYESFISKPDLDKEYPRVREISFDSKRKLMSTLHKDGEGYILITKGAPDVLITKSNLEDKDKRDFLARNNIMASRALRVLAIGYKKIADLPALPKNGQDTSLENDLTFLGLIGLIDPPRPEAKSAVILCKKAGIKPVMITGDHVITARAIAENLGILTQGDKAITGAELSKVPSEELVEIIDDYTVFARVSPEHKVQIVKAYKAKGYIVAMTGDGINDAPALKAADIGCAMGITGTDVAKGAADMILQDDNFATIVEAIREGRSIYQNIRKAVHFLLSSNIGEIITILAAIFAGLAVPLLAIQLLWVNLVTDSFPALALGVDPADEDIMENPSAKTGDNLFTPELWKRIILEGAMIGGLSLTAFVYGTTRHDAPGEIWIGRTMCFAVLGISQLVHAFNMRSEKSLLKIRPFSNIYLVGAFFAGLLLQITVIMTPAISTVFGSIPLNLEQWSIVALLSIMPLIIVEIEKFVYSHKQTFIWKAQIHQK
ncbi:MAG: cation-translocating P-type ATPase [Defluviitaleaceae bacterium]|nr:cation-translocating P-type ATPase [Defluviitaleaceae bacterium]